MGNERLAIVGMDDLVRDLQRRGSSQERRRQINKASDLLGPGFAPTAIELFDWNQDEASFNGFFFSDLASLNSPDPTLRWAGMNISNDRRYGIQKAWAYQDTDPIREYDRSWTDPGETGLRTYTPWRGDGVWENAGITVISGCTLLYQRRRMSKFAIAVKVGLTLTTAITVPASGDISNRALLQAPDIMRPSAGTPQPLLAAGGGPVAAWNIADDGTISITAVSGGATLNEGATLTFGGVYFR